MLTVAGIISQSSYQSPAFERRRARNRRQTAISAIAQIAMILPPKLVSSSVGLLVPVDCCICIEAIVPDYVRLRLVLTGRKSWEDKVEGD